VVFEDRHFVVGNVEKDEKATDDARIPNIPGYFIVNADTGAYRRGLDRQEWNRQESIGQL
jgi:hypothetical protein